MNKEHFSKPAGWVIPVAEIRMEDECLFAHYDIEKEEKMMDENEQQMTHSDNTQEHFIACYIRVPHIATLDAITQAIKDNGRHSNGIIAQEVKDIMPEVVDYDETDDVYRVDYTSASMKLIGAMFKKMKQMQEEIDALKSQNNKN